MFRRVLKALSQLGALMSVVAGLLGAVVVWRLGPPLAMGLALYTFRTLEPVAPEPAYPWALHGVSLGLCGGAFLWSRRDDGPAPQVALQASAFASALVPFWGLFQLWSQT